MKECSVKKLFQKKLAARIFLQFLCLSIALVLFITPAAAERNYAIYSQWSCEYENYKAPGGEHLAGSGCGMFALSHIVQWFGFESMETDNSNALPIRLWKDCEATYGPGSAASWESTSHMRNIINTMTAKYTGRLQYEDMHSNNAFVGLLQEGKAIVASAFRHYYALVDIASDSQGRTFIHIIDSNLATERSDDWSRLDPYSGKQHFSTYQRTVNADGSYSFNAVDVAYCAARYDIGTRCDSYTAPLVQRMPNPLHSGGEYWVEASWVGNCGSGHVFSSLRNPYFDSCTVYPADYEVRISAGKPIWSLPCSDQSISFQRSITQAEKAVHAKQLIRNDKNNYWYLVTDEAGDELGYVYSGNCTIGTASGVPNFRFSVEMLGRDEQGLMIEGLDFVPSGYIRTSGSGISMINGVIYHAAMDEDNNIIPTGAVALSSSSGIRDQETAEYDIRNTPVSTGLQYKNLAPGLYSSTYKLTLKSYYIDSTGALKNQSKVVTLEPKSFRVAERFAKGSDFVYTNVYHKASGRSLESKFDDAAQAMGAPWPFAVASSAVFNDTASQTWIFVPLTDGTHLIEDLTTGMVLVYTPESWIGLTPWDRVPDSSMKWYVLNYGDHFEFAPASDLTKRLTIGQGGISDASVLLPKATANDASQQFRIVLRPDMDPPRRMAAEGSRIGLTISDPVLDIGQIRPITASLINYDHEATTHNGVRWVSSNPEVASVNSMGEVIGRSVGTAVITAISEFNPYYTGEITVTVSSSCAHSWRTNAEIRPVGCTTDGITEFTCLICGLTEQQVVPAAGHQFILRQSEQGPKLVCTVCADALDVAWGWQEADTLPAYVTEEMFDIEYQNTYISNASQCPGSGWVQGGSGLTRYENSGEPYTTGIFQSVSDTRVLLRNIYFHYCGAGAGTINFHSDSVHNMYHEISADGLEITSQWNDDDDPRYVAVRVSWQPGQAYSGAVTCSQGIPYWYKGYVYQDRIAVTDSYWQLTGDWTTQPDPNADSVRIRFRLKDETAPRITSCAVTAVTPRSFTFNCHAEDPEGIALFRFQIHAANSAPVIYEKAAAQTDEYTFFTANFDGFHGGLCQIKMQAVDVSGNVSQSVLANILIPVLTRSEAVLQLPDAVLKIDEEAFAGNSTIGEVILPENVEQIDSRAFADCDALVLVQMNDSVTSIAPDAFEGSTNVILLCPAGSTAADFARSNGIPWLTALE